MNITGILLAAGQSSRFGSNKLQALIDNKPMLLHSADCLSACQQILVVVSQHHEHLHALLDMHELDYVVNRDAKKGMGSSIACGVANSRGSDGWLILPADMPFIPVSVVQQLLDAMLKGKKIVAPEFKGRRGHPAGFHRSYYQSLLQLHQDYGARDIIENSLQDLHLISVRQEGVLVDIDTVTDLENMMTS